MGGGGAGGGPLDLRGEVGRETARGGGASGAGSVVGAGGGVPADRAFAGDVDVRVGWGARTLGRGTCWGASRTLSFSMRATPLVVALGAFLKEKVAMGFC